MLALELRDNFDEDEPLGADDDDDALVRLGDLHEGLRQRTPVAS